MATGPSAAGRSPFNCNDTLVKYDQLWLYGRRDLEWCGRTFDPSVSETYHILSDPRWRPLALEGNKKLDTWALAAILNNFRDHLDFILRISDNSSDSGDLGIAFQSECCRNIFKYRLDVDFRTLWCGRN